MVRSVEDLAALILAADEYRETVAIEYMGEQFAVPIRPLTEGEMIDVSRQMKISFKMISKVKDKLKGGKTLTPEEEEALNLAAAEEMDIGDVGFYNYLVDRAYCQKGIADDRLKTMVAKFRYGLTESLSNRIQTISKVPPEVIANFFGQPKASSSSL